MSVLSAISLDKFTMGSTYEPITREVSIEQDDAIEENPEDSIMTLRKMHLAAIAALLNIVGFGLSASYTAPASVDMMKPERRLHVTADQITWIASLGAITGIIGGPSSGFLSQKLGRKAVLMYISLPYLMSWLMVAYAPTVSWIYAGRLLTGFCCGVVAVTVPMYVVEISTPKVRGLLGAWFQVAFSMGVLMSMALGMVLTWSWLAITGAMLVSFSVVILYFMPESPHWLVSKGRDVDAMRAIEFLRGPKANSSREYQTIARNHASEPIQGISFAELKQPQLYKPIFLTFGLMFFQQFAGVNALMSYTVEIFEHAESSLDPSIATIVVASIQVLFTVLSSVLMDKAGRRVLYIVSGIFVTIGLFLLGLFGFLVKNNFISTSRFGWIPVAGFIIFVASFSMGYGPIPWLMAPEMVPVHTRSTVVALAGVCNGIFMFAVTKTFVNLQTVLQDYGVFWFYGIFSLFGCVFCWYCLPETKGKSVEEIQLFFSSGKIDQENKLEHSNREERLKYF